MAASTRQQYCTYINGLCLTKACFNATGITCIKCIDSQEIEFSTSEEEYEEQNSKRTRTRHKYTRPRPNEVETLSNVIVKKNYEGNTGVSLAAYMEDRQYVCPFCDTRFDLEFDANKHISEEHKVNAAYQCSVDGCDALLSNYEVYTRHMSRVHKISNNYDKLKPVSCPKCSRSYTTDRGMRKHYVYVHGEGAPRVKCSYCHETVRRDSMYMHVARYHKSPTQWHKCTYYGCDKAFSTMSHLRNHVKRTHEWNKYAVYPCKNCKKMFTANSDAQKHYKYCARVESFLCKICKKIFTTKSNLNMHKRIFHL